MSAERKLLIFGGIALAAFGMLYGLHYAVFVEHQTLDRLRASLAEAFVHGAQRRLSEAHNDVAEYAATRYAYVRQVDVHSHWIGLAMLMIVLGMVFDELRFAEHRRVLLAWSLLLGSAIFP